MRPQPQLFQKNITSLNVAIKNVSHSRFEIKHKSGVTALADEIDGEFLVLKDSKTLRESGYVSNTYAELKKELIVEGILVEDSDQRFYTFAHDYVFKSVSAAAAVVLDRNSNGRTEWKVAGSATTYNDWQRQNAGLGTTLKP